MEASWWRTLSSFFPAAGQGFVVERFDNVARTIELPSQCITEGFDAMVN